MVPIYNLNTLDRVELMVGMADIFAKVNNTGMYMLTPDSLFKNEKSCRRFYSDSSVTTKSSAASNNYQQPR